MLELSRRARVVLDLILVLVSRELKVRYRGSFLGLFWSLLQPLLMASIMHVVFSNIFRFQVNNYPVYALTGILFWNFFSQSVTGAMNSLKGNAELIQKTTVPHVVFPIASVVSGVVHFLFALGPLLLVFLVTGHRFTPALAFLPIAILIAAAFTLGAGLILSPLAVFFSDVIEFVSVLLVMLMYLTPTFYPMSIVPDRFLWLVRYNPLRSILETLRDPIYFGKVPPLQHVALATTITVLVLCVGLLIYRRSASRIAFFA